MTDPILTERPGGDQAPRRPVAWLRRHAWGILAVLGYAAIAAGLFRGHTFPLLSETDGIGYMQRASGPVFQLDPFHGPGYSFVIRLARFFGPGAFAAAKLVSLFFGLVMVLVVRRLVSAVTDDPAQGWAAALVLMLNPLFLVTSMSIMSDTMGSCLVLASLAALLVPREPRKIHIVLGGVFAGMAYLTRYVYLFALVFPLLLWVFRVPRYKDRKDRILDVVDFLIGFLVVSAPWLLYVLMTKGNPFWNLSYLNAAFKMYEGGQGWNYFPTLEDFGGWSDVYNSNPGLFVSTWWFTLLSLPARLALFIPGLGVVLIAGAIVWLFRVNRKKAVFLTSMLAYAALVSFVWFRDRFLLLFIPLMAWLIASALLIVPGSWPRRLPLRGVAFVALLAVMGFVAAKTVPATFDAEPLEYKTAAAWLASVSSDKTTVLAPKPHIAFFSGTRNMDFRGYGLTEAEEGDLPRLLAQARPDFVVYDERYALLQFPELENLLHPELNPYPDLLNCVLVVDEPMALVVYRYSR